MPWSGQFPSYWLQPTCHPRGCISCSTWTSNNSWIGKCIKLHFCAGSSPTVARKRQLVNASALP